MRHSRLFLSLLRGEENKAKQKGLWSTPYGVMTGRFGHLGGGRPTNLNQVPPPASTDGPWPRDANRILLISALRVDSGDFLTTDLSEVPYCWLYALPEHGPWRSLEDACELASFLLQRVLYYFVPLYSNTGPISNRLDAPKSVPQSIIRNPGSTGRQALRTLEYLTYLLDRRESRPTHKMTHTCQFGGNNSNPRRSRSIIQPSADPPRPITTPESRCSFFLPLAGSR